MAAVAGQLARAGAEGFGGQVGELADDVEQRALARGLEVRDARLDEVARDIQLVAVAQVGPAVLRLDELEVGVEVAVVALRLGDGGDEPVELGRERRVGMRGEPVARGLDPFGQIGILPEQAVELALLLARGDLEIVHAAAALGAEDAVVERLPLARDDGVADQPRAIGEKAVLEADAGQREGGEVAHGRFPLQEPACRRFGASAAGRRVGSPASRLLQAGPIC
jgi:hypothetical protein